MSPGTSSFKDLRRLRAGNFGLERKGRSRQPTFSTKPPVFLPTVLSKPRDPSRRSRRRQLESPIRVARATLQQTFASAPSTGPGERRTLLSTLPRRYDPQSPRPVMRTPRISTRILALSLVLLTACGGAATPTTTTNDAYSSLASGQYSEAIAVLDAGIKEFGKTDSLMKTPEACSQTSP